MKILVFKESKEVVGHRFDGFSVQRMTENQLISYRGMKRKVVLVFRHSKNP